MMKDLVIIKADLLKDFLKEFPANAYAIFENLHDAEISTETFSFYTSVSSVFSGKIEGEDIELDSYIKYKRFGIKFLPDYTRKTDDLYATYRFAQGQKLNLKNISEAHKILSRHLIPKHQQGKYRIGNMYVTTPDGKIEYVAVTPYKVENEMNKFYHDVNLLLGKTLSFAEVFFFASMFHLVFVKIHPWNDGNGRSARLIEKWFLAEKLGEKAWFLPSEKHYYGNHHEYYNSIRKLGFEYETLDYSKSLPFLRMLPQSLLSVPLI